MGKDKKFKSTAESSVLRETLVRHYRGLRRHGINDSHSGNASVRRDDFVWITPAGACADTLEPGDLVACALAAPACASASRDWPVHRAVYLDNDRARALLHGHGPHTVALTLSGGDFEPPDLEGRVYFSRVPVIDVGLENHAAEAPGAVRAALRRSPVVVVRGHGIYAWGESLDQAYKWLCSLEHSAKIAWLARQAGTWRPA